MRLLSVTARLMVNAEAPKGPTCPICKETFVVLMRRVARNSERLEVCSRCGDFLVSFKGYKKDHD